MPVPVLNQLRLARAAIRVLRDPERLPDILDAVTQMATPERLAFAAQRIAASSPVAARALVERRLLTYSLAELAAYPAGTVGHATLEHCTRYGIDPAAFPERPNRTAGEHVVAHIEATHDIWHAVLGFASDIPGELGLQAFYMAQLPNLLGHLLLCLTHFSQLRNPTDEIHPVMDEVTRGWTMGKAARPLFGIDWSTQWHRPLVEVRAELGIH